MSDTGDQIQQTFLPVQNESRKAAGLASIRIAFVAILLGKLPRQAHFPERW